MKRASLHRLAWLGVVLALVGPLTAQAGEGHDHGGAPAAPSANGPQRQPDGSVFLPKPAQRQLGVRTMVAAEAELPRSVELNGKVLVNSRIETLLAALGEASGGDVTQPLVITADAKTAHELVVRAMDAAGRLGFSRLSITTRLPQEGG